MTLAATFQLAEKDGIIDKLGGTAPSQAKDAAAGAK